MVTVFEFLFQIIKRANELGEDPVALSRRFCEEFQVDMELLRCLSPNVEPRVTDHIPQIIKMISKVSLCSCTLFRAYCSLFTASSFKSSYIAWNGITGTARVCISSFLESQHAATSFSTEP